MVGMPAAGAVGAVISGGRELSHIAISPAQNYAIGTAADGSTWLVLATGAVSQLAGAAPNPSRMAVSPQGSSAALWVPAGSHFQVLSGLPGAAAARDVDATAFGEPIAFAVSDDGQVAASWPDGVRVFGSDGSVNPVSIGERVLGLAFFTQRGDLALVTMTRVLSVVNGSVAVVHQPDGGGHGRRLPDAPAGIAVSADNRWIVAAFRAGSVVTVNVAAATAAMSDCDCAPEGVFALGGSVFRLTSKSVKLIDAPSGAVFVVPPAGGPQ
jgi:DNA-binding beta-propeller fold protein YncE